MTIHNLFLGGDTGTYQQPYGSQYPSAALDPNCVYRPDDADSSKVYTIPGEFNTCEPEVFCHLQEYLQKNPIVVGDYLNMVAVPRHYCVLAAYWELISPLEGFTADLELVDLDGNPITATVPWDLGTDLSDPANVNTINHHCATGPLPAPAGAPCIDGYMSTHGVLRLCITGLPEESLCDPCSKECVAFAVSVSILDHCNRTRARSMDLPCPLSKAA